MSWAPSAVVGARSSLQEHPGRCWAGQGGVSIKICSSQLPLRCPCATMVGSGSCGASCPAVREHVVIGTERHPWADESQPARPGQSLMGPWRIHKTRAPQPIHERVFLQHSGSFLASPSLQHPVERDKQTASTSLIYVLIGKRSSGGEVALSRAQPALPLLTAQQHCLRTQIPPLSSPEAVKMYFLLCRFSFWRAGSQVGLETVKVGNKVVH